METAHPTRILVVDDHFLVRMGFVQLIRQQPDMEVVGEAATGQQAIRTFFEQRPDVTLMDLRLPGMSGVEAIEAIRQQSASACIVVLTAYEDDLDPGDRFRLNVQAAVSKNQQSSELLRVIRAAFQASTRFGTPPKPPAPAKMVEAQRPGPWSGIASDSLRRVLRHIREHLSGKITLAELARIAGTSRHHFVRRFKTACGVTPYQYVLACRVEQAKHLLSSSEMTLAQIAYEVGFASQSHFHTTFLKLTGTTPDSFRRSG